MTLKNIIEAGKKIARFPRDAALFLYALPTLRRMYTEKDSRGKGGPYSFYRVEDSADLIKMNFYVGIFTGTLVNVAILGFAGLSKIVSDHFILTALPLPIVTNAVSGFYETKRLSKNRRVIEKGREDWERMVKEGGEHFQKLVEKMEAKARENNKQE